jgi:serine phosphatase RsbU (regulator of sigma subunit)
MLRQDLDSRFITIVYMLLTIDADHAEVAIACAGHPAPILIPAAGEPTTIAANGTLLGVWSDISLRRSGVRLSVGDSLVAYTDGVTDHGPQIKPSNPIDALRDRPPGTSAEQLAALLDDYADRRSGRQRDDIAILALRFRGDHTTTGPPPEPAELADEPGLRGTGRRDCQTARVGLTT